MRYALIKLIFLLLILPVLGFAQDPTKWSLGPHPINEKLRSGDKTSVTLNVKIEPGWHLYALDQPAGGPIPTTIKVTE